VSGWPLVTLSEVFDIARGGSPRPIDSYITNDQDGINWITIGDASEGSKYITGTRRRIRPEGVQRSRMVQPGDFLLTNSMSFGKPYIMRTDGCIHDGWLVLSPRRGDVDADFFYHLLGSKALYTEFKRRASGATVKNLNIDLVKGVTVPLPPLAEQRRIAKILDKADALRAKRRAALAQLDTLTQSIFLDMFGDPARNTKGLPTMTLGKLGAWRSGGTPRRSRDDYFRGSVPWLSSGELNDMYVYESKEHVSLAALRETTAKAVPKGALMLGMYDTAALKASIAGVDCSCNQAVAFAKIDGALADSTFVYFAIVIGRDHFRRLQRGVRQKNLNLSMVRAIAIPKPSMQLQLEFATRVTDLAKVRKALSTALAKTERLLGSLQHRAFRGEL
jgi:type I restriction enzyme S subunit